MYIYSLSRKHREFFITTNVERWLTRRVSQFGERNNVVVSTDRSTVKDTVYRRKLRFEKAAFRVFDGNDEGVTA